MIHMRVRGPGAGVVVVVACNGATFVVGVEEGLWTRVVEVVDEVDELEVVDDVVVDDVVVCA
jgi:hypothetical protein